MKVSLKKGFFEIHSVYRFGQRLAAQTGFDHPLQGGDLEGLRLLSREEAELPGRVGERELGVQQQEMN